MNRIVVGLLTLVALSIAIPAGLAGHCAKSSTTPAELISDKYYVVADVCQPTCVFSVVVYEETNGRVGLQRADSVVDDTCHGRVIPDQRVA